MQQPKNWRSIERHPLSAEYDDIGGAQWKSIVTDMKENGFDKRKPIILHEDKILDGWQRQRACVELGIRPTYAPLPRGRKPEEFVRQENDNRRHETSEAKSKRIAARREKVAELREEGKSTRLIAEEVGVSQKTVMEDLKVGESNHSPEKVVGKDGVAQSSVKAKKRCPKCERAERVGQEVPKNCEMCKELNAPKEKKEPAKPAEDKVVDDYRNEIPAHARKAYLDPWIQDTVDFLSVEEEKFRKLRIADGLDKRKDKYPFIKSKDVVDGIAMIMNTMEEVRNHFKENRPSGVCPKCEGEKCTKCKQSGMVPRALYKELKDQKKGEK
jgi:predicted transcriptional regulator